MRLQREHRIPLVKTREDHHRRGLRTLRWLLYVDEPSEQVEPGVALPDPLPEVGRAVPMWVGRVACPSAVTEVERQEARRIS